MSYKIEAPSRLSAATLEEAAELTALGFGRENDAHNYDDTEAHLTSADTIHFVRHDRQLVAFAAYRSSLWRLGN